MFGSLDLSSLHSSALVHGLPMKVSSGGLTAPHSLINRRAA